MDSELLHDDQIGLGMLQKEVARHKKANYSLDNVDWSTKPKWTKYAARARWLVHWSDYGVASTVCSEVRTGCPEKGLPFGNIMSISDGTWQDSTGIIYTYLPDVDPSPVDLAANPHMTITFSERALPGGCLNEVAEDPPCTRVIISGMMTPVPDENRTQALNAMFSKHPQMESWPADHGFIPYWIAPENMTGSIFMLDMYGPSHPVTPENYFAATF